MLEVFVREAWARARFNGEIAIWDLLLRDASGLVSCEAIGSERGLLGFWVELCLEPAAHSGHQPTSDPEPSQPSLACEYCGSWRLMLVESTGKPSWQGLLSYQSGSVPLVVRRGK
jgi:hypothetical protein